MIIDILKQYALLSKDIGETFHFIEGDINRVIITIHDIANDIKLFILCYHYIRIYATKKKLCISLLDFRRGFIMRCIMMNHTTFLQRCYLIYICDRICEKGSSTHI